MIVIKKANAKPPKGEVVLKGLDNEHHVVIELRISVSEYYDSLHPILDEEIDYRRERGIRFVNGVIYNYEGAVDQEFKNSYGEDGAYLGSQIRFADGTVAES